MQDLSSQTRDQTLTLCIGRHRLNCCTVREVLKTNKQTNKQTETALCSQQEQREGTQIPHVFPAITHIRLLPLLT